jgi:hypothetical protein
MSLTQDQLRARWGSLVDTCHMSVADPATDLTHPAKEPTPLGVPQMGRKPAGFRHKRIKDLAQRMDDDSDHAEVERMFAKLGS